MGFSPSERARVDECKAHYVFIIRETWEDKAKPLEGVASYILQMRSCGRES